MVTRASDPYISYELYSVLDVLTQPRTPGHGERRGATWLTRHNHATSRYLTSSLSDATRQIVEYWDSRVTIYLYIPDNETSNFAGFDGIV